MDNYRRFIPITPSDVAPASPPEPSQALVVGTVGTVVIVNEVHPTGVSLTLPAGIFPIRVQRVLATGTTATGLAQAW